MKDFFKDQFFKALEKNTIFSRADVQGNKLGVGVRGWAGERYS